MPFITSTGAVSAYGIGLSNIAKYIASYWLYVSSGTANWATLNQWYKDSAHTQATGEFPSSTITAVLLSNASADVSTWSAPGGVDLNGKALTITAHEFVASETDPFYSCAAPYVLKVDFFDNSENNGGELTLTGHFEIPA